MGASSKYFLDKRENEELKQASNSAEMVPVDKNEKLKQASNSAEIRANYRKQVISLIKSLTDDNEKCLVSLTELERIEPKYVGNFDDYILTTANSPIWNIERVISRYKQDDTYNMKKIHIMHLEIKLMERKRIETGH